MYIWHLNHSLSLPLTITTIDTHESLGLNALINSGATGSFIDESLVLSWGWNTVPLQKEIPVFNIDTTPNSAGRIRSTIDLIISHRGYWEWRTFCITNLGKTQLILGYDWLKQIDPLICWSTGEVTINFQTSPPSWGEHIDEIQEPESPQEEISRTSQEELEDRVFFTMICATETISQWLAIDTGPTAQMKVAGLIPDEYQEFLLVFEKSSFDQLPNQKKWDYTIKLKPRSESKYCKVYLLNWEEQGELDDFIKENLKTGHIHPSRFLMTSPVFFIKKKNNSL